MWLKRKYSKMKVALSSIVAEAKMGAQVLDFFWKVQRGAGLRVFFERAVGGFEVAVRK
jgi:hypothetical protein